MLYFTFLNNCKRSEFQKFKHLIKGLDLFKNDAYGLQ
jgi:hypothetical protein